MKQSDIRKEFPQLEQTVYSRPLVYLDNAATSLRCRSVVDKWEEMSLRLNSNLHRAVHRTANLATREFEDARAAVGGFIGADAGEIVFTSGTTQSVNMLAFCLGEQPGIFAPGDEILIAECEHHSNIVPWQLLAERKGLKIKVLPVNSKGELPLEILSGSLSGRTKLCCVAQVSNVLGVVNPVREIADICHANGTLVLVDGAQGIVHLPVDVKELGCDFYAFSGHKMYAATGTGVLYGRRALLEALPPFMGGGEMIGSVSWAGTTYADPPHRFEAGTQNIAGIPTFKPAIEMVKTLRDKDIVAENERIKSFISDALSSNPDVTLYGLPDSSARKIPLFSFSVAGAHHEDLALIMDKMGIALRSGQMCAEPLMDRFGVTGMLRASFAPYNTMEEAEYFVECLHKAVKMLK